MTNHAAGDTTATARASILPHVFYPTAAVVLVLVGLSFAAPKRVEAFFLAAKQWTAFEAGWFTVLAVAGFLVFVVCVALSPFGHIKLGPDHSEPDYSYGTWFAMLFAAGMGIGLMFFGVAEPIMHFAKPPIGTPETVGAARQAMRITLFHWGIHAWAIYAVVALSLAYFAYRHRLPLRMRSALYPLVGDRIYGPIGHTVDSFAALGTIFGLATSLGLGVMQINSGLNYLFGVPIERVMQVVLIAAITAIATVSVVTGLDRGVRRLSELNLILSVTLLVFVLLAGPTVYLLQTWVQNTGEYISNLLAMTFNLYAYEPTGWIGGWTLFYWGWWIAWSPFVGMFIARISRGRTVRQFLVGVLLAPVGFTFAWMTIYGNTALHMVMADGAQDLVSAVATDSSVALFHFLERLPLAAVSSAIATLVVVVFFVTSADSGALVIDMLTSKDEAESPVWQRVFWSVLVGTIAVALLVAGGLEALQAATIAAAFPFTFAMILMCVGLVRAMRLDVLKRSVLLETRTPPGSGDWKARLGTMLKPPPSRSEVTTFLDHQVKPVLTDVAGELSKQGIEVSVDEGEDGRVWLEVGHGNEIDFFYSVHPKPYEPPSFILQDPRRRPREDSRYYRAEVYLREGGQDYDVMGWRREDLIYDVLDQYQRHRRFLDVLR